MVKRATRSDNAVLAEHAIKLQQQVNEQLATINEQLKQIRELELRIKSRGEEVGAWMDKCRKESSASRERQEELNELSQEVEQLRVQHTAVLQQVRDATTVLRAGLFMRDMGQDGPPDADGRLLIVLERILSGQGI